MRGITTHLSHFLDRKLDLGWNYEHTITHSAPHEKVGIQAILGLQAVAFTTMATISTVGTVENGQLVNLPGSSGLVRAGEVFLNTMIYGPRAVGILGCAALAIEAAVNIRHVGENYTPLNEAPEA